MQRPFLKRKPSRFSVPTINWPGSRSNLNLAKDDMDTSSENGSSPPGIVKKERKRRVYVNMFKQPRGIRASIVSRRGTEKDMMEKLVEQTPLTLEQGSSATPTLKRSPQTPTSPGLKGLSRALSQVDRENNIKIQNFVPNRVSTSKYTLLTFLPKNLFEQFRSVANFYFLSLVILQMFPPFALVSVALTAAPVVFIVAATAIKDGIEDLKRHRSDANVNNAKTYLLSSKKNLTEALEAQKAKGIKTDTKKKSDEEYPDYLVSNDCQNKTVDYDRIISEATSATSPMVEGDYMKQPVWRLSQWQDVRVGDFVLLRNNDSIPADMVIVATSEPDCICYVETKNLDGETNLKIRRGISHFSGVKTAADCAAIRCFVDSEPPSANLHTYSGVVNILPPLGDDRILLSDSTPIHTIPIGINGVLLRGCVLRNTKWVVGITIFTGPETKIMMNSGNTPSKRSKVDRQLNPLVFLNFMLLAAMCLICGLTAAVYTGAFNWENAPFASAENGYTPFYSAVVTFFSCMIIFQNIIPIALYISVDITKSIQSLLIHMDNDMWDEDSEKSATPQAWNLCDDLGQIEYIFSDKTGTLTSNMMEFRKCSINGVLYGDSFVSEAVKGAATREGKQLDEGTIEKSRADAQKDMLATMASMFDTKYVSAKPTFIDPLLPEHLQDGALQSLKIREFFTLLAVCHTVLVEKPDAENPNHLEYKAQSPDEAALVAAARDVGFAFLNRTENNIDIDLMGEVRSYTILHVLEFNSTRKRMSVIVRRPEGQIVLLVKGADSIIFERLKKPLLEDEQESRILEEVTAAHLEAFATEGLRTLCLAYKVIPGNEYERWAEKFHAAQATIKDREKNVDAVAEMIEKDLTLMGATAIEDKLQDGVPDTIGLLSKAGIKIWVLTGDKMETAINIGFSSNLLKRNMLLIVIKSNSMESTYKQLTEALEKFWGPDGKPLSTKSHALIIDGVSLKYALSAVCKPILLELGCRCKAVICCRVSPLQKARVVSLVRKGLGAMCLAIGDGANDVSMIQEADIGIGISGKEGLQAVMASDYAISQFRFLSKLLLVHGRWGYVRASELVLNYFYKNAMWLLVLFWYQFDCGFTGDLITDFSYSVFFNTLFTLFPTMIVGIFDQDINHKLCVQVPKLYQQGIRQSLFTMERFWMYMLDAVYQSLIAYYFGQYMYSAGSTNQAGFTHDKDAAGTFIAFSCVLIVNLYNGINTYYWSWITFAGIFASFIIWTAYVVMFATAPENRTYGQLNVLFQEATFYLGIAMTVAVALLPRLVIKYTQQYFMPTDTDIISEVQKYFWQNGQKVDENVDFSREDLSDIPGKIPTMSDFADEVAEQAGSPLKRINSDHALDGQRKSTSRVTSIPVLKRSISEASVMTPSARASVSGTGMVVKDEVDKLVIAHHDVVISPASLTPKLDLLSIGVSPTSAVENNPDGFMPIHAESTSRRPSVPSPQNVRLPSPKAPSLPSAESYNVLNAIRKASQTLFKSVPSKLRIPAMTPSRVVIQQAPSASLIFMATHEELPNTGFCFSHEGGMSEVISPMPGQRYSSTVTRTYPRYSSEKQMGIEEGGGEVQSHLLSPKSYKMELRDDSQGPSRRGSLRPEDRPQSAYGRLVADEAVTSSQQSLRQKDKVPDALNILDQSPTAQNYFKE
ncbi:hypothetical protein HDV05_004099 [Chytridiales sp. JEL 0842]|nr:hypothetical protein HDV05_004099 [Chytridiales sp. JEL 0842]